jgi:hypothetical protein
MASIVLCAISILYAIGDVRVILCGKAWFLSNHFLFRDAKKSGSTFCVSIILAVTMFTIIYFNGSFGGLRQLFLFLLCFYYIPQFSQTILGSFFICKDAEIYRKELSVNQNLIKISEIKSKIEKYMSESICLHFVGVSVMGMLITYYYFKMNYVSYFNKLNNALHAIIVIHLLFFLCTFGWDCFNLTLFLNKIIEHGKNQNFVDQENLDASLCETIFSNNRYFAIIAGLCICPMFTYLIRSSFR